MSLNEHFDFIQAQTKPKHLFRLNKCYWLYNPYKYDDQTEHKLWDHRLA